MKIQMTRTEGGKVAGSVHDLTKWAAMNFVRMRAAKLVCDLCGEAPRNIDNHGCIPREMPAGLNRMMSRGVTR
jgi:hypothetical protein